jgi:hypothetical protein
MTVKMMDLLVDDRPRERLLRQAARIAHTIRVTARRVAAQGW